MIYKSKFLLTGTAQQIAIVAEALDKIKFPWERLTFPKEPVEIGWKDLNNGLYRSMDIKKHESGTLGIIEGRKYTLGIFYTHSGRIYIDNYLVNYPEIAQSTVSAEIAHAVDYFLPLTDSQRNEIMALMHGGSTVEHGHSWWEKYDYGAEYYTLVGESFMQAFTVAYSDMPFGNASDFTHSITPEQAPALRKILGIERTDYVSPVVNPTVTKKPKGKMDRKLVSEEVHEAKYIASYYKIPVKIVREAMKAVGQSRKGIYEYLRNQGFTIGKKTTL